MEFTVAQIAQLLNGKVIGDASRKVNTVAKIQEATEGSIAFLSNLKYENHLYETQATAVLVGEDFTPKQAVPHTSLIVVKDAYVAFSTLLGEYQRQANAQKIGIETPSFIDPTATLGEGVYVGAFAYIGAGAKIGDYCKIYPHSYVGEHVQIGAHTTLYAGVKVYAQCVIGSECVLQAGAVVGSDGFGFAPQEDGTYKTIPQVGNVILGDRVDVGANTTIDCATMGSTVVHSGVKLDNLVQVGHNVTIGENTVIASQTGLSGSVTLGRNNIFAGQVGVVGHLSVPDRTTVGAQSGLLNPPKEAGKVLLGSPAIDHREQLRNLAVFRKLPDLKRRVDMLEEKINTLSNPPKED